MTMIITGCGTHFEGNTQCDWAENNYRATIKAK